MFVVDFGIIVFKQKTAYEMRISDWSSDVCSSDLADALPGAIARGRCDGARRAGVLRHLHRHIFGAVADALAGLLGFDRDVREKAGRDERLPKIVGLAAVVEVAALEARHDRDMIDIEAEVAGGLKAAEARARAALARQHTIPHARGFGTQNHP